MYLGKARNGRAVYTNNCGQFPRGTIEESLPAGIIFLVLYTNTTSPDRLIEAAYLI